MRHPLLLAVLALFAIPCCAKQDEVQRETRRTLAENTEIGGVPCRAGLAWMRPDGTLASCSLSRPAEIRGASLPAGSRVALEPDGSIRFVFLPGDTVVEGHRCRGGGHDWMTRFHPNGRLRTCWLADDEEIDGVPCRRASFWQDVFGGGASTELREDGSLAACAAAREVVVEGRSYGRGERVRRGGPSS